MCNCPWREAFWSKLANLKHLKRNKRLWSRSITVARTGQPGGAAQFNPDLTDQQLEQLQMDCVAAGLRRDDPPDENSGVLIESRCAVRLFYRRVPDIGASNGHPTDLMFVEYHNSGVVHGRPITDDELMKKRTT
jgi:hypothetical protein